MNIDIIKIFDAGNLDQERVTFYVKKNDFIGGYLAFKTKKNNGKSVSSKIDNTYWFPDKDVKEGDLIVLYTKKGINTEKKNEDQTTTHFFYLNKENPIWLNPEDAVLIMSIVSWVAKSLSESQNEKKET